MKTGAPTGNQNARKTVPRSPQRRVAFTPKLWATWLSERFDPPQDDHAQKLAAGIQEFRNALSR